jgi:hypothetical protein
MPVLLNMSYGKDLQCWNKCGTMEILNDDSENEDVCEVERPKTSRVLDSISEVRNWMERQSECYDLHLLHLQNIKTCDEETSLAVMPKENIGLF